MQGLSGQVVENFTKTLLSKNFDELKPSPEFHRELWDLACSDNKHIAVAAPRGHAKSTVVTHSFVLACVCFRVKSHVLILSDTERQAIDFLGDIKNELLENEKLRKIFKLKFLLKDKENEIVGLFQDGTKFRILARGSEQKLRGIKWQNQRPDLVVCDDLENDEIVLNDERRDKFKRWFTAALLNCGSYSCDFRVVGTILHLDSLLESFMPAPESEFTVQEGCKIWSEDPKPKTQWVSVKYQAHNEDYSEILWPEMFPEERLRAKYREHVKDGIPEVYAQEFLNIPIDPSTAFFRKDDLNTFIPDEELGAFGDYYATADLAISEKDTRAYTVFIVGKLVNNRFLDIVDVVRFRGDSRRIIDTMFQIQEKYNPVLFGVEEENIAKSLGPILEEEMGMGGRPFINIEKLKPVHDKLKRARPAQARVRSGKVRFNQGAEYWPNLFQELSTFPRSKWSDQADAFAWLCFLVNKMADIPAPKDIEDYKYEMEYESMLNEQDWGSDVESVTGY